MGILHKIAVATLPLIPRSVMRRLSARYIAGETLEEALGCLEDLSQRGYSGILDILGEDVSGEAEARTVLESYKQAASDSATRKLDSYVSIKPTHFGLRISKELCHELYAELLVHCAAIGQFVRVEMEDHTTTQDTLDIFARLRAEHSNVGIVLQSRLLRTADDITKLPEGPVDVRMVKGIYLEPEEIAHTHSQAIRDSFLELSEALFKAGHRVAFATHDEHLGARLLRSCKDRGVDPSRYEFEVLLGVQQPLWQNWRAAGHKVRVYVPYGPQWRAYSQRRLRKNPEIFGHVLRGLLKRK
ncbi:MAG: proline dehydrogenase [Planctomycetota bacterium]|jgi:proline dehydrogenase